ncbi:MAG: hypothetical protein JRE23_16210 [Deltaproteobacteria bacterium]|nr:hypothetical protein [Deltaproteobacteria bacterium]
MKFNTVIIAYQELNARNFGGVLRQPIIVSLRHRGHHAAVVSSTNKATYLTVNPKDFDSVLHMRSVIYHEMTHQYVEEFLGIDEEEEHGPIFWRNYRMFATPELELGESL